MKQKRYAAGLIAVLILLMAPRELRADGKDDLPPTVSAPQPATNIPISQEFDVEGAYNSGIRTQAGQQPRPASSDEAYGHFNYVISPQINDAILLPLRR